MVRLFDQKMKQIALHVQQEPPGVLHADAVHILPQKISGIERGAAWLLGQVERIGPNASAWAEAMLRAAAASKGCAC